MKYDVFRQSLCYLMHAHASSSFTDNKTAFKRGKNQKLCRIECCLAISMAINLNYERSFTCSWPDLINTASNSKIFIHFQVCLTIWKNKKQKETNYTRAHEMYTFRVESVVYKILWQVWRAWSRILIIYRTLDDRFAATTNPHTHAHVAEVYDSKFGDFNNTFERCSVFAYSVKWEKKHFNLKLKLKLKLLNMCNAKLTRFQHWPNLSANDTTT